MISASEKDSKKVRLYHLNMRLSMTDNPELREKLMEIIAKVEAEPDDEEARTREVSGKTLKWVELSTKSFVENAPAYGEKSLNYTKPELRERLKREIMAGSKGGKPGQWSARKAQLLANEYRKAGGGYRGKPRKIQRSLKSWTRQKWRTSDGKPAIRKGGTRRYLPAKAWSRLTPAQRAATNRKKIAGSKAGRQFVANTERAESASRSARR